VNNVSNYVTVSIYVIVWSLIEVEDSKEIWSKHYYLNVSSIAFSVRSNVMLGLID